MSVTTKGKCQIFDIRKKDTDIVDFATHGGPTAQKNVWVNDTTLITSGKNRQAEREYATWDIRDTTQPVFRGKLGNGSGVAHLYFDQQHQILYSAPRGDMAIQIYQYSSALPENLLHLYDQLGTSPTKGFSIMPKWCLDIKKDEVDRGVHMTNDKLIQYRSFNMPNKNGSFEESLFPPFPDNKPNNTYAEWAKGEDKPPIMRILKETDRFEDRPSQHFETADDSALAALGIKTQQKQQPVKKDSAAAKAAI